MKSKLRTRVENLAVLLHMPKDPSFLTLHCLGYFEDGDRFAFVYAFPDDAGSLGTGSSPPTIPQPCSLLDLLRDPTQQPSVTARVALTLNIARTLLAIHTAGWLHKDFRSDNIQFFPDKGHPVLFLPYVAGFAFSHTDSQSEISEQPSVDPQRDIYRHPDAMGEPSTAFEKRMDLYSLGTVMIEIAEWRALRHVVRKCVDVTKPGADVPLDRIASVAPWLVKEKIESGVVRFRMGEVYSSAVAGCLGSGDSGNERGLDSMAILRELVEGLGNCII